MFDTLGDRLERISSRLRSRGRISDEELDEVLREIRTALLEADVELGVVRAFTSAIRDRCSGGALDKTLTPGQQVVKEVHEQLISVLGGQTLKITYAPRPPTVVLLAGLQGSGKTTASAKLALWWKQQGRNPLLVGADLQRPAAVEQLRVLGAQAGISVFSEPTDPVSVAVAGVEEARRLGRDICIIDTAGRLSIDVELMQEVRSISERTQPHYTFLVIDAMTGQDAVATASAFHETLALDAVILSKLDGDARGGAALSVKGVVGKPIAFASTGERLADFELFHPDRMADRILGMGDVLSLIEQAERSMDHDSVTRSATRMLEGKFTLDDFLAQLQQVMKLGSFGGIMKLMPGISKEMRKAAGEIDDSEISRVEAIIRSMTPAERSNAAIIDGSRRVRIAKGSGTSVPDVNALLKQFREMQKMMKGLASGKELSIPGMSGAMSGATPGAMPGIGRLAGALGGRKAEREAMKMLDSFGGADSMDGLAGLMGSNYRSEPTFRPSKSSVAKVGGKKKKKGGRVTPRKAR